MQTTLDSVKAFGKAQSHALVIGDVMLDRYLIGSVSRISPEAPVPVVLLKSQEERAGGAANVAANLALLGIDTKLLGCIGDDIEGRLLIKCIQNTGVNAAHIVTNNMRPTIAKTRVLGGHQQMVRIDQEHVSIFSDALENSILDTCKNALAEKPAIVILSDYAKGLLSEKVCQNIIKACRNIGIPVLVDPKGTDYRKYLGATALTPNKKELAEACHINIDSQDLIAKASELKSNLNLDFLAVTKGEEGITFIGDTTHDLTAMAKQVFDVCGAGDTVIATLAAGLMHHLSPLDSLTLANTAAAVVVGKVGTAPISQQALIEALANEQSKVQAHKVCNLETLMQKVHGWQQSQQKIVFTNGCFDLLHAGHVTYLEAAKNCGDKLILGLNTDRSVSALKGPNRPVVSERDRARVLAALESVDAVILFDEDTPLHIINTIKPNIIAKGSDYLADEVVGGKEAKNWGGEIVLIDLVEGKSTSNIIKKMNA